MEKRVLIVDDDRNFIDSVSLYLENIGVKFDAVTKPFEAIELFEKKAHDLVFCDLEMPGLKGDDLISWIKAHVEANGLSTITYVVSGLADENLRKGYQIKDISSDFFVRKPLLPPKLDEILDRHNIYSKDSEGYKGVGNNIKGIGLCLATGDYTLVKNDGRKIELKVGTLQVTIKIY